MEIFETVAERLGEGLSILIDLLNPERIVIGSIYLDQEKLLKPLMEKVIHEERGQSMFSAGAPGGA